MCRRERCGAHFLFLGVGVEMVERKGGAGTKLLGHEGFGLAGREPGVPFFCGDPSLSLEPRRSAEAKCLRWGSPEGQAYGK